MEVILGTLAFLVAVLAVLQGWQMVRAWRTHQNPDTDAKLTDTKLDTIITQLGRMEQRMNDIWDRVKE